MYAWNRFEYYNLHTVTSDVSNASQSCTLRKSCQKHVYAWNSCVIQHAHGYGRCFNCVFMSRSPPAKRALHASHSSLFFSSHFQHTNISLPLTSSHFQHTNNRAVPGSVAPPLQGLCPPSSSSPALTLFVAFLFPLTPGHRPPAQCVSGRARGWGQKGHKRKYRCARAAGA